MTCTELLENAGGWTAWAHFKRKIRGSRGHNPGFFLKISSHKNTQGREGYVQGKVGKDFFGRGRKSVLGRGVTEKVLDWCFLYVKKRKKIKRRVRRCKNEDKRWNSNEMTIVGWVLTCLYVYIYTRSFHPLKKVAHATEISGKKEYLHEDEKKGKKWRRW